MPPRILLGWCVLLVALLILSTGCRDRFECGILLDGTPTVCSGATEVCLCGERRCAETAPEQCPESGYAYVFPEKKDECVPPEQLLEPVISSNVAGTAALCPDQAPIPPRCGLRVSGQVTTCPGNLTCLCDLNLCASFERTDDCTTGWRRAVDGQCLDITSVDVNIRPGDSGLCPGALAPAPRIACGRPNLVGLIEDCPEDQTCICGTNRCAIADSNACPDTRFRYAPDSPDDPAECVAANDAAGERVEAGACSDFRASRIACGTSTTGPDCPDDGQRCVCDTGFCAESATDGACGTTGLQYVGSGECISETELATTIDEGLCAPDCGVLADDGRIVQCPFGDCICGDMSGQCAVNDASCPTGSAFVANDRCVTYTATVTNQLLVSGQVCPASPVDNLCGVPGPDGRLLTCAPSEACLCQTGEGRCARPETTCPNGRAFVPTNRCAPADGGDVTSSNGLLCPGAPQPPAVTCGELDSTGRIRACQGDEQCICRPAGGACATPEPTCPFGLANANDGTCVSLSSTDFTRPVAGDALCPPLSPAPIACGLDAETECGGLQCGCRTDGSGICVLPQASCPLGIAEAETLRCIRLDENLTPIDSGACAPGVP